MDLCERLVRTCDCKIKFAFPKVGTAELETNLLSLLVFDLPLVLNYSAQFGLKGMPLVEGFHRNEAWVDSWLFLVWNWI
jgi:hypothetical protein